MARILVVDDDGHIREVMRFALEQAGHRVTEAQNGVEALRFVREEAPDLMVLDIVMPEEDGLSVCRKIRAADQHNVNIAMPIIFVSSRDEELDRVLGLELGADDYVTKPFSPRELVARVSAVLRRVGVGDFGVGVSADGVHDDAAMRGKTIVHGPFRLDPSRHRCFCAEEELTLTVSEFALLQALLERPGRVLERMHLVRVAYGDGHVISDRTVDSHLRRIRKKLGEHSAWIETVYGVGYRMAEAL